MMKRFVSILIISGMIIGVGVRADSKTRQGDIAAVITTMLGDISFKPAAEKEWSKAKKGQFLYEGDSLKSGSGSKAALTFVNGIEIKINENSAFTIDTSKPSEKGKGNTISMNKGQIWSRTMRKGTQFDIKTPAATVAIRGSTFDARIGGRFTKVKCYDGHGYIENKYGKTNLKGGEQCSASYGEPPAPASPLSSSDKESWQHEVKAKGILGLRKAEGASPKVDESFKLEVWIEDESGEIIEDFSGIINLTSNNRNMNFSGDGKNWKERMYFRLRQGKGAVYAAARKSGTYLVSIETSQDYTPAFLRVGVASEKAGAAAAEEKVLKLQIKDKDGNRKNLEIKFRK